MRIGSREIEIGGGRLGSRLDGEWSDGAGREDEYDGRLRGYKNA